QSRYPDNFYNQQHYLHVIAFGIIHLEYVLLMKLIAAMGFLLKSDTQHQMLHHPTFPMKIILAIIAQSDLQFVLNLLYVLESLIMTDEHLEKSYLLIILFLCLLTNSLHNQGHVHLTAVLYLQE